MFRKTIICALGVATLGAVSPLALAEISADQAARLSKDLTPLGAIRAGNEAGTIPAWEGGIKSPADAGFPDFKPGGHHPDPFASDEILYTVTAANAAQYADLLTVGNKAMLDAYPSYKMNVYPTRRSAAFPERIYQATERIATTATLIEGGNGVTNAINGFPFPIPSNGTEAIW